MFMDGWGIRLGEEAGIWMDLKRERERRCYAFVGLFHQSSMFHVTTFASGHNSFLPIRISEQNRAYKYGLEPIRFISYTGQL